MIRTILSAAALTLAIAAPAPAAPAPAAPCKDVRGKFTKCPERPKAAQRCRAAGKFVKCGTPGAKPS